MVRRPEVLQAITAAAVLVCGLLVYLLDRDPEYIYFLPDGISLAGSLGPFFGVLGNYLPTFTHVYAFILLTAAVTAPWPALAFPICAAWFAVDSLFEIAQHAAVAPWIAAAVPGWFDYVPFLENTAEYFLAGTFDPLDLISIGLGAVAAYLTILAIRLKGETP